jgi:hypothetical protein
MWKIMLEIRQDKDDNILQHMRIAYLLTKAKDRHLEYVLIITFPLQQWVHDKASNLLCMYIVGFIKILIISYYVYLRK